MKSFVDSHLNKTNENYFLKKLKFSANGSKGKEQMKKNLSKKIYAN